MTHLNCNRAALLQLTRSSNKYVYNSYIYRLQLLTTPFVFVGRVTPLRCVCSLLLACKMIKLSMTQVSFIYCIYTVNVKFPKI